METNFSKNTDKVTRSEYNNLIIQPSFQPETRSEIILNKSISQATTTPIICNETISGVKEDGYRGCQNKTISGATCQKWTDQSPHEHSNTPEKNPNKVD